MAPSDLLKLALSASSPVPVMLRDGKTGLLLITPTKGQPLCGVQVPGEEYHRWLDPSDLVQHGRALSQTKNSLTDEEMEVLSVWHRLKGLPGAQVVPKVLKDEITLESLAAPDKKVLGSGHLSLTYGDFKFFFNNVDTPDQSSLLDLKLPGGVAYPIVKTCQCELTFEVKVFLSKENRSKIEQLMNTFEQSFSNSSAKLLPFNLNWGEFVLCSSERAYLRSFSRESVCCTSSDDPVVPFSITLMYTDGLLVYNCFEHLFCRSEGISSPTPEDLLLAAYAAMEKGQLDY